jgi:guanyl-specific ribonuclease Sa
LRFLHRFGNIPRFVFRDFRGFLWSAAAVAATAPVGSGRRRRRVVVDLGRLRPRVGTGFAAGGPRRPPAEAQSVDSAIRRGGPFAYPKDGIVFANRERLLPEQPRGFYREYTVPTPGAHDRGADASSAAGAAHGARRLLLHRRITTRAFTGSRHERSRNFC